MTYGHTVKSLAPLWCALSLCVTGVAAADFAGASTGMASSRATACKQATDSASFEAKHAYMGGIVDLQIQLGQCECTKDTDSLVIPWQCVVRWEATKR